MPVKHTVPVLETLADEKTDEDPDGHPTIGYGHLCSTPSCSEIPYSIPLSESDGAKLLQDDLAVRDSSSMPAIAKIADKRIDCS